MISVELYPQIVIKVVCPIVEEQTVRLPKGAQPLAIRTEWGSDYFERLCIFYLIEKLDELEDRRIIVIRRGQALPKTVRVARFLDMIYINAGSRRVFDA
jgi:hypothetical protein